MRGPNPEREAYWRRIMARQAESGLSAAQFCQLEKIAAPSFYGWKRKLRERDAGGEGNSANFSSGEAEPSRFVPVRIKGHQVDPWKAAIRIHWRWGIQVEIPLAAGRDTIDHLLRALSQIARRPRSVTDDSTAHALQRVRDAGVDEGTRAIAGRQGR